MGLEHWLLRRINDLDKIMVVDVFLDEHILDLRCLKARGASSQFYFKSQDA